MVVLVAVIWCGLDDIRGVTSRGLCGEKIFILHCVTASLFLQHLYKKSSPLDSEKNIKHTSHSLSYPGMSTAYF